MRGTLIFAGSSCPALTGKICENLGMAPADAELSQFSNGETSVRILTSVREKDVFVIQSGSPKINDTIMELLIMISACKGGSANKITAVLPYFPYSRQSKKKSHRGAITARMLANLLGVAGVKHVITVDLHASQMQGFFKCPVDNLHAEPLIARWIRHNVPNWKEAVVVSKNAGGTKRVTSLADALKLNFGMVTTDKKRGSNMTASMIMNHLDGIERQPFLESISNQVRNNSSGPENGTAPADNGQPRASRSVADANGSPRRANGLSARTPSHPRPHSRAQALSQASTLSELDEESEPDGPEYNDQRAHEVTHGRLVQGHIVPDDFPSPATSAADASVIEEDPMAMSHASSFFAQPHALGGSGDAASSDEEDEILKNPKIEHMITLVGDVKNRTVLIVDDMIDKPGSWIAAAETVVKRGFAKRVYCIATHAVFGADCLEQMQACDCIDAIVVTNSYPIREDKARNASKLVVLDLSFLLAEAIRRNHYGESMSPLFLHMGD
ncbi:ribose-phosphate diphosphokinase [Lasiosphaeria miniovina]|uniref:Ribose-phosphate pyrophosphokinase 1 n=1 Tax=Lasiosphaeria miniovina TaxID=1954250 RepID=A0AA40AM52_9PEZI|nr:ribose-phosphate diphosphokinase [Lasiosphaeria miniovina]KAK0718257.1 ribose-phosphate diphosphokinase [Lasiosphaeria miniovina]